MCLANQPHCVTQLCVSTDYQDFGDPWLRRFLTSTRCFERVFGWAKYWMSELLDERSPEWARFFLYEYLMSEIFFSPNAELSESFFDESIVRREYFPSASWVSHRGCREHRLQGNSSTCKKIFTKNFVTLQKYSSKIGEGSRCQRLSGWGRPSSITTSP